MSDKGRAVCGVEGMGKHISAAMRQVLEVCATAPDGTVWVADLVAHQVRRGGRLGTVRGSLSRTLRRLWRLGLVELAPKWGDQVTMTSRAADIRAIAEEPDGYADYRKFRAAIGRPSDMTEQEYYAHQRARVEKPELRVRRVILTEAGRQSVNSHALERVHHVPRKEAPSG